MVTVDPEVAAGNRAIAGVSDRKLVELRAAIADYEAEFGLRTPEEMAAQGRKDRENATVVGGRRSTARRPEGRNNTTPSA